ncbi:MAG TPA: adenylate/guanylate cyclase domain-containing protein [Candidatus Dormibacteraeota bacterium]|nr:adenylate/guanylate cyclase domain-containing protein [Candidatus Dormibacteraeota bacterium]
MVVMATVPETVYASNGTVHLAYQVLGAGPFDVLHVPEGYLPIDLMWDEPVLASAIRRIASFSRLISCDLRGWGSSDAVPWSGVPAMQAWMDDLGAVLDAAGSEQATFFAAGGQACLPVMLFAATHPERVRALVLWSPYAKYARAPDYPWGVPQHTLDRMVDQYRQLVGTGRLIEVLAPSRQDDAGFRRWWARCERLGAGPGSAASTYSIFVNTDVRAVLSSIQAPTLLLRRSGDGLIRSGHAKYLADQIAHAQLIELPGTDYIWYTEDADVVIDHMQSFLTGVRAGATSNRVLSTVLFTDIVGSTQLAEEIGDQRWSVLLARHDDIVARHVASFRGRVIRSTGDGVLATFDGPARAIQCARAMRDALALEGLKIRTGLHTGEVELKGTDDIGGIAVHIAARVMALAGADEILVSGAIPPLVLGSGISFTDRGTHPLKGVAHPWPIFAVEEG